ncbi:MAG: tetratricopeptide repeat-containing protein, partial [Halodesulfovibrio sp.]
QSMGGLVDQYLCSEYPDISEKTSHLIHYGTPSGGLHKARFGGVFKRQVESMRPDGVFIQSLRKKWDNFNASCQYFNFMTVAGDIDDFVPTQSSLAPFDARFHAVVPGGHIEIVKPKQGNSLSVEVLRAFIKGENVNLNPRMSAALAVERLDFKNLVQNYVNKHVDMDCINDEELVLYALGLEHEGRRGDAIDVLERRENKGTDALGVLGGRFKRLWIEKSDNHYAERAFELYNEAYVMSLKVKNYAQCHYHAINLAFLSLLYLNDKNECNKWANEATHYASLTSDKWAQATLAEAYLYFDMPDSAFRRYERMIRNEFLTPREMLSMLNQAVYVCEFKKDTHSAEKVVDLFFDH